MLILKDEITFWWPVTVKRPDETAAGKFATEKFAVLFEALGRDEAEALDKEVTAAAEAGDETKRDLLLHRVVKGWREVVDEEKQPIEFSASMLETMLRWSWNRLGLYNAWIEANQGEKRRLGN